MKSFQKVLGIAICLIAINVLFSVQATTSYAQQLFTFNFEAVYDGVPRDTFPVPTGTTARGSYTFNLNTGGSFSPTPNTFTSYSNPITDFRIEFGDFGVANYNGAASRILLGDPVQTTGSEVFLSDQYVVEVPVSGLTLPTTSTFGDRELIQATIELQDIDLEGLDSEFLSSTPPELRFFEDNIIDGQIRSDRAEVFLNFRNSTGGTSGTSLRLTSLTVVPEPSAGLLGAFSVLMWSGRRRRKN